MRRQTSYRRIAAELPPLGTLATTRRGEVGEVIAHEDDQARLQFAGSVQGLYAPDEITWQVVGAQTEGKWQTEGAELHLADRDYPELADILNRPAPAIVQEGNEWGRTASKSDGNNDGIEKGSGKVQNSGGRCEVCDQPVGGWETKDGMVRKWHSKTATTETVYDPYNAFSAAPGDCETCFGEGAFSDLNPDGKGFGPEHDCPDCGGTGKAS